MFEYLSHMQRPLQSKRIVLIVASTVQSILAGGGGKKSINDHLCCFKKPADGIAVDMYGYAVFETFRPSS